MIWQKMCACVLVGERVKRTRHYQGVTYSSWCGICVYICMYGGTCAIM